MKTFNVSGEYSVAIYGAAHLGKEILVRLKNQGISVECFLDKRAAELVEVDGVKVIYPYDYAGDKDKTVVIMAISDPVSAANRLSAAGFKNLVYRVFDFQNVKLPAELVTMERAFQTLMNGQGFIDNIPEYNPATMDIRFANSAIISDDSDSVVVRVPLDLIFAKSGRHVFMHNDFLSYLEAFSLKEQINYEAVSNYAKSHSVEKLNGWRYTLTENERYTYTQYKLKEYNLHLEFSRDWFEKNPVKVTFSDNKFFVDDEYLFRVMFFLTKRIMHIPARMSRADYESYINRAVLDKVIDYLRDFELGSYSMVEHPNLYNVHSARDIGGNSRFLVIGRFFDEIQLDVKGLRVVDVGAYAGIMSRFLARLGANVTSVEMNRDGYNFEALLNELLHCNDIEMFCGVIQDFKPDKNFDLAILMNVLHWHLTSGIAAEIVQAIDKITNRYLLWESGDNPSYEKELIIKNSSFKNYTQICMTIGTGRIRELGFWTK